ncbi:hypothetical protein [Clostridium tunisiense]|uniref:hypothetical protein n=1 Tax=Clostridium tunisiense TaxID=219748 RepID=UPI0002F1C612|nr:hypothetical protein [Clostridium tunisiense]
MKLGIAFILLAIIIPKVKTLTFLAIGRNPDEAITLYENGLINFFFTRAKLLMAKIFNDKSIKTSKTS